MLAYNIFIVFFIYDVASQEFIITDKISDFKGANKICSARGEEIVRVDNMDIAKYIYNKMNQTYPKDKGYWINANDIKHEGMWVHNDGSPAATTMWSPGEPNSRGKGNCAVGGWNSLLIKWIDHYCDMKFRVICAKRRNPEFIITNQLSDFEGAHKICSELGLEIVRVDNTIIATNINAVLNKKYPDSIPYWIDANDKNKEGTFVHYDGTPAATDMWEHGEPNTHCRTKCVIGNWKMNYAKWADYYCFSKLRVICSKNTK